jgi:colanic acid/amylovoran biosynthesis glycosyltransferase
MKGISYSIRAFAMLSASKNCVLRVVGDGPELELARRISAELGVIERVTFLGALGFSAVAKEFAYADVFLLHSVTAAQRETEGLPVAICEAMANCLPVVSTRHAGIPEVVKDGVTGLLVAERDVASFYYAMKRLADDPAARRNFGNQGRIIVEREFGYKAARGFLECLLERSLTNRQNNRCRIPAVGDGVG